MKMELVIAGVPKEELDQNSERIREALDWAVNNGPHLDDLLEVQVDDSISCHDSFKEEAPKPSSPTVSADNAYAVLTTSTKVALENVPMYWN
jgi:hypothetical protein